MTENILAHSTTIKSTTTSTISSLIMNVTNDIYNDNMIWDDPDLDYNLFESMVSTTLSSNTTTILFDLDDELDLIDEILLNSTLVDEFIISEPNISINFWDFNDTSSILSSLNTTSLIQIDDNDWTIFNTTFELPITRFDHLSLDAAAAADDDNDDDDFEDYLSLDFESYSEINSNLNDDNGTLIVNTTTIIDLFENFTEPLFVYDIKDHNIKDQLLEFFKPYPTLALPPFSWMLSMISPNKSELSNSTTTTSTTTTTTQSTSMERQTTSLPTTTTTTIHSTSNTPFEYCKNKKCYHDGRLNSDCLCICLPAFTGDHCETVLCDQEPIHICTFILEHECETDHIRHLCPKFCQINNCTSKTI
ncbi:hypothetical protein I4U23_013449 [Adineta vaga]|nr:hypothetical protein I4U23_013449 [Adineta vaga]